MSPSEPQSDAGEFQDPLEDYSHKTYDDPLEQALADQPVASIQATPFASIPPDTPIQEAIQQLAKLDVACFLVELDGKLVGVFSDRDILDKVALDFEKMKNQPVSEVMTKEPIFVYDTDSSAAVLSVMAVSGYRHVPVLNLEKNIVGIVSPQRVTGFLQQHVEAK